MWRRRCRRTSSGEWLRVKGSWLRVKGNHKFQTSNVKRQKMKKAFWWILGILLTPVLLFAVLAGLLYLPPVQNWAVDKVAEIASEKTGMQISVGHVNLAFPLDLAIDDFKMIHGESSCRSASRWRTSARSAEQSSAAGSCDTQFIQTAFVGKGGVRDVVRHQPCCAGAVALGGHVRP